MRPSRSWASAMRRPSWPSSQAMRNWRPLMVTVTCDMAACSLRRSPVVRFQDIADGLDRDVEATRDFAIGGFERAAARCGLIELGGETGAVGAERVQLVGQIGLAAG